MDEGFKFQPKGDITVSELATILSTILSCQGSTFQCSMVSELPEECVRHFEKVSPAQDGQNFLKIFASKG